jgi:hypothetical protein
MIQPWLSGLYNGSTANPAPVQLVVAVCGLCLLELHDFTSKHGVLEEAETELVNATGATIIKVQVAVTMLLNQLLRHLDVNILFVQQAMGHVADLSVTAVSDVLVMLLDLI